MLASSRASPASLPRTALAGPGTVLEAQASKRDCRTGAWICRFWSGFERVARRTRAAPRRAALHKMKRLQDLSKRLRPQKQCVFGCALEDFPARLLMEGIPLPVYRCVEYICRTGARGRGSKRGRQRGQGTVGLTSGGNGV